MDIKRYFVGGIFSIAIHGVAFSSSQPPMTIAMASQQQGKAVSIQFINLAQASTPPVKPEVKPVTKTPARVATKPAAAPVSKSINPTVATPVTAQPSEPVMQKTTQTTLVEPIKTDTTERKITTVRDSEQPVTTNQAEQATANASTRSAMPKLMAKATFKTKPTAINYPRKAKRRNMQGEVLIEVWLDKQGNQIKRTVVSTSGYSLLDDTALTTIANWQFQPAQQGSIAIAHRVRLPITFKLD